MKELHEAYALAAVGGVAGIWRYYIRPELTAGRAWAVGGVLVGLYELAAPDGELLSNGADRLVEKHPVAATLGIWALAGAIAGHLTNTFDERYDPIHQLIKLRS